MLMEPSKECESIILVPPLQSKEGFFVLTFFHTTFKPVFFSVQDGYIIDNNLMSTHNNVLEDCILICN